MSALDFVRSLLDAPLDPPIASAPALRVFVAAASGDTAEQAVRGGRAAASLGWAFAAGYIAALRRLDPALASAGEIAALCASEEGGAHPRALRATLAARPGGGFLLTGDKAWVTLGREADTLLVVASTGQDEQGRNRLRAARVPSTRAGVSVEPGAPLSFAPEIEHARVVLRGVPVAEAELLPGDGYDAVLKPFRTIEDTHVVAATIAWAVGLARSHAWEPAWVERALALLVTLRGVAAAPPSRPETHLVLAGAMALGRELLDAAEWSKVPDATRALWLRDRPLLDVASRARAARREAAWRDPSA